MHSIFRVMRQHINHNHMWGNKHFSAEIPPDPQNERPSLILSFGKDTTSAERAPSRDEQLLRLFSQHVTDIDERWCTTVDGLLNELPTNTHHSDWLGISLRLVDIIRMMHNSSSNTTTSDPPTLQSGCEDGTTLTVTGQPHPMEPIAEASEGNPIPFEIGLKLLSGTGLNETLDETTQKAVEDLQRDVAVLSEQLTNRDDTIDRLTRRLQHWRNMAKVRLRELRKEFEFRERMIFGDSPSQFNSTQ